MALKSWWVSALLASSVASAGPNPDLDRAQQLLAVPDFPGADKALEAARRTWRNDAATVRQALELSGVVAAGLGQEDKARRFFEQLLVLEPEWKLSDDYPPRVNTSWLEARQSVDGKRLQGRVASAKAEAGLLTALTLEVSDPLRQSIGARLHLKPTDSDTWQTTTVAVRDGAATWAPGVGEVLVWAELLDANDGVLVTIASEASPRRVTAPPEGVPGAPVVGDADAPPPFPGGPSKWPLNGKRIAGITCLGAGAVALAVGAIFGAQANGTRATLDGLAVDSKGRITGVTQKEGYALDDQLASQASTANVLFITAGALALAGGGLLVASFTEAPGGRVVLVPTGPGLALVGTLP